MQKGRIIKTNMEMMKMETITENEEFNYDTAIGKILMIWTNRRGSPFHGRLIRHNYYTIMIENIHKCIILIQKKDIFYTQLKYNQPTHIAKSLNTIKPFPEKTNI
jgi:hypothetical protein